MKKLAGLLFVAMLLPSAGCYVSGSGRVVTPGVVVVAEAPPPPPPRRVVVRPGFVWIEGRYHYRHGRYVWVDGRYERERRGYRWVPGRWQRGPRGHRYIEGRWEAHGRVRVRDNRRY